MASREAALTGMAAFRTSLYNICMRRNSIYMTAVIVAGYASTNTYFSGTDSIWKSLNKGKSWEEVQARLPPKEDDDDED